MSAGRLVLVTNPRAGRRAAPAMAERARATLAAGGTEVELVTTERAGHARELARERDLADVAALVGVGGDGTTYELLNGLFERPAAERVPLGLLPAGSGNSLARDLAVAEPDAAVAALARGATRALDAIRLDVDGRTSHACNVVGWGAVARINARAEGLRTLRGARYLAAAAAELCAPRLRDAEAALDGEPPDDWLLGTLSVTRFVGNAMQIAPAAELDDGRLDLVRVRRGGRVALARLLSSIFTAGHVGSPLVEVRQLERLTLELPPGRELVVDGERVPARRVELRVEPRAWRVVAPPVEGRAGLRGDATDPT